MEKDIIKIISDERKKLEKRLHAEFMVSNADVELRDKIASVLTNLENIVDFDLEKIRNYVDKTSFEKLLFYSEVIRMNLNLDEKQIANIKNWLGMIVSKLNDRIIELNNNAEKQILDNEEISLYDGIIEKLSNFDERYFTVEEIKKLNDILVNHYGLEKGMILALEMATKSLKNMYDLNSDANVNEEEKVELVKPNEVLLDENEVLKLFSDYGYADELKDLMDKKNKNMFFNNILKYGNIDRMKSIFEKLKENKIHISNFVERAKGIYYILCFSDADAVDKIINSIKENIDGFDVNSSESLSQLNYYFSVHLKTPAIFVKLKKEIIDRKGEGGNGKSEFVPAAHKYYFENIELLKQENIININELIEKCGTFFSKKSSTNKRKKQLFDFYEIPVEQYTKKLSVFLAPTPLNTIDLFIELGCGDYLRNNFSRVKHSYGLVPKGGKHYDLIFYKIKYALIHGLPIFNNRGQLVKDIYSDELSEFGITKENKEEMVNQYDFVNLDDNALMFSTYDKLIDNSENDIISISSNDSNIKKLDIYMDLNNKFIYNFDGVIISRYKLLRYYSTIKSNNMDIDVNSIIYSACKNSILTKEEYDKVKSCIFQSFGRKDEDNKGMRR